MLPDFPDLLLPLLARPDLQALAQDVSVHLAPEMAQDFVVPGAGRIVLGHDICRGGPPALVPLRHALELSALLRLCPDRPALAGLAAARTTALFAALEGSPEAVAEPLSDAEAALAWSRLATHQPGIPALLPDGTAAALRAFWSLLGPAEWLMQSGGDVRLLVDPETGLNGYGCSHRPRPWAVTFASSTASSSSERGYAGAEAARRRVLGAALRGSDGVADELEVVRRDLAAYYRLLPGSAVILAASGTDCELLALALARLHPAGQPITNILVAPEETGSGVPLAATGRHFAIDTARGETVEMGSLVAGYREDTVLASVALRDPEGRLHPSHAVEAGCAGAVSEAVRQGRRAVLHLLDVSKTGLLAPAPEAIRALEARYPGQFDVVVDACQARITAGRVSGYVEAGWTVLVTGSKFFTGPPFAGAVLVPPAIRRRLDHADLPRGLRAYSGRAEWPPGTRGAGVLATGGNFGLALRWQAALAEMHAFAAVPAAERPAALGMFVERVRAGIAAAPYLHLVEVPPPRRPASSEANSGESWDTIGTILSFAVRDPATGAPMAVAAARQLYRWLNADLAAALPPDLLPDDARLARQRFHVGQPVPLRSPSGEFGALRVSAGARLVTGEPSHAHLGTAQRLEREIGDALAALAKIELILRHLDRLRRADPAATFL
jgi:hypothetical protein